MQSGHRASVINIATRCEVPGENQWHSRSTVTPWKCNLEVQLQKRQRRPVLWSDESTCQLAFRKNRHPRWERQAWPIISTNCQSQYLWCHGGVCDCFRRTMPDLLQRSLQQHCFTCRVSERDCPEVLVCSYLYDSISPRRFQHQHSRPFIWWNICLNRYFL